MENTEGVETVNREGSSNKFIRSPAKEVKLINFKETREKREGKFKKLQTVVKKITLEKKDDIIINNEYSKPSKEMRRKI
ncbi:hypothetical protein JTB14_030994 [Gonioctena quinquepunctata]|nr:hypothetical protein JTB14_030994 [Gonioctena quinquepunctata]